MAKFRAEISEFPDLVGAIPDIHRNVSIALSERVSPITARAIERTPRESGAMAAAWEQHPTETGTGRGEALVNPLPYAGHVHPRGDPQTVEAATLTDIQETAPSIAQALSGAAVIPLGG